jgi:formate dehydrogenase subunit gamma
MSTVDTATHGESATAVAQHRENVVVGDEIVRHRRSARLVHGAVALTFFVCLFTGMPIWSPIFGWMSAFFGGLAVCRWLHPWSGLAFGLATMVMTVQWRRDMAFEPSEKGWLGPKLFRYMRYEDSGEDVGKYNGGQKLFFWSAALGALALVASGLVLWNPYTFPQLARAISILLHDAAYILFAVAIVYHIYLGTAAEPGTFRAITRGTVTKPWARLHHPRWFREVTGGDSRPK